MRNDKHNLIVNLTIQFALDIVSFFELLEEKRKFIVARQLLKSGTSISANVRESQNADSKADFVHKLKIAVKEADETEYRLLICKYSINYPNSDDLLKKLHEIIKLLSKIINTSKRKK